MANWLLKKALGASEKGVNALAGAVTRKPKPTPSKTGSKPKPKGSK